MKQETKQKTRQSLKQELIVLCAQKTQYSLLRISLLLTVLTSLGILGRVALQGIPSVEPLTPLAILIGFFLGPIAGFISGVSGFFVSNFFVWGFQGPWTIFQSIGAGIAGFIGGIFGNFGKKSRWKVLAATAIGITIYEIIVTASMGLLFGLFNLAFLIFYLITSIPFSVIHLVSSLGFSMSFYEFKEQLKKLKGGKLIEKEILGLRVVDSDSSEHGNKLVPEFYYKKIFGSGKNDKGKPNDRFWFIKRKEQSD